MPTLYTLLRAQHRHKVEASDVPIPTPPKRYRSVGAQPILASERVLMGEFARTARLKQKAKQPNKRIAIVGAGFAGLCAAYELQGLKYEVVVYEARDRVGGRVHSCHKFIPGKVVEFGGELIGSNHALWNSYRHHFKLHFSDVEDYGNSPVRFGNRTLSFEESQKLTDEMEKQMKALSELAETIIDPFEPWANRDAKRLDAVSFSHWVSKSKCSDLCKEAMELLLAADNGIPASQQSLLGVLAMIKGGGLDRYWTDTEVYRCKEGNDALAKKFEAALNKKKKGTVVLDAPVTTISPERGKWVVKVSDQTSKELGNDKPFDDVILAVPPSVWGYIQSSDKDVSDVLRNAPKTGSNVKYLMRIRQRFWEPYSSSPTLSEDGPVDITWETTEEDKQADFGWVAFSGANDSEKCRSWAAGKRRKHYTDQLEPTYPGVKQQIVSDHFADWPSEPWSKGSYYFPRLNEVTQWGPLWKAGIHDSVHFAGEHTSYAFVGYMEGALSSGYRVARRIAVRDKVLLA